MQNHPQQSINPDTICQQAVQAKMNMYRARENFETAQKVYNDAMDSLINCVGIMKARIIQLEEQQQEEEKTDAITESAQ